MFLITVGVEAVKEGGRYSYEITIGDPAEQSRQPDKEQRKFEKQVTKAFRRVIADTLKKSVEMVQDMINKDEDGNPPPQSPTAGNSPSQ